MAVSLATAIRRIDSTAQTQVAPGFDEAISALDNGPWDLVIADVVLTPWHPGLRRNAAMVVVESARTGLEVARAALARQYPVLVTSSYRPTMLGLPPGAQYISKDDLIPHLPEILKAHTN